ncbi:hypothetical protein ABZ599_00005, partial [Streptomyces misionensis]
GAVDLRLLGRLGLAEHGGGGDRLAALHQLVSTPPEALGRVWGAVMAMAFAAAPVGIFATGWLAQNIGLRPTLGLFGGLYVLLICYVVRNRPLRGLAGPEETRAPVSEDAATAG